MKQDIKEILFIVVAFLLGSINVLYNGVFYTFMVIAFLVNLKGGYKDFWENVKQEKKYLLLPIVGVGYLVVHYLCSLFMNIPYKASWSMVETLLAYFLFIPLYLLSAKKILTFRLLRHSLFALCVGILCFNMVKLFYITGTTLFTTPVGALNLLYSQRFGTNMDMLGGFVYLEPQAIYIVTAAVISYFFILNYNKNIDKRSWLVCNILFFILFLIFLSFTVTKGSILAFLGGALFLTIVYFRKKSRKFLLTFALIFCVCTVGIYFLLPSAYMNRFKQVKNEIENVQKGNFQGSSIAPRLGLIKENFSHFDEFGLFGLGVYKGAAIREWYANSPYRLTGITNAHNSFVEFWLIGGVPGLLFIFYYFFAPICKMVRSKNYSFLTIALFVSILIAANTCVIFFLEDSKPLIVFIFALSFFYLDRFIALQHKE